MKRWINAAASALLIPRLKCLFFFLSTCLDPVEVEVKVQIIPCTQKSIFKEVCVYNLAENRKFNLSLHADYCLSGFRRLLSLPTSHGGETIAVGPQGDTNPSGKRFQGKKWSIFASELIRYCFMIMKIHSFQEALFQLLK